jgi:hypothetical protein
VIDVQALDSEVVDDAAADFAKWAEFDGGPLLGGPAHNAQHEDANAAEEAISHCPDDDSLAKRLGSRCVISAVARRCDQHYREVCRPTAPNEGVPLCSRL